MESLFIQNKNCHLFSFLFFLLRGGGVNKFWKKTGRVFLSRKFFFFRSLVSSWRIAKTNLAKRWVDRKICVEKQHPNPFRLLFLLQNPFFTKGCFTPLKSKFSRKTGKFFVFFKGSRLLNRTTQTLEFLRKGSFILLSTFFEQNLTKKKCPCSQSFWPCLEGPKKSWATFFFEKLIIYFFFFVCTKVYL